MTSKDAVPLAIAVRSWGLHGLWLAVVMDGSTVVARIFALSEEGAFERARAWAAPRAATRANWAEIPEPRESE